MTENTGWPDRLIRITLGIALCEVAYFWIPVPWQYLAWLGGGILLFTGAMGTCPVYHLAGVSTVRKGASEPGKILQIAAVIGLVVLMVAGSTASDFFTRKIFLEDYNAMNQYYKQALFLTGQNDRAGAVRNYERLVGEYATFHDKYSNYRPYAVKADKQFDVDLDKVAALIAAPAVEVRSGDLHQAHLALEKVRPVFQELFKRNHFSLLAITLVEFHDVMELMLDAANEQSAEKTIALYPRVSDVLKAIEAESNDGEIQAIRSNLDAMLGLAKAGQAAGLPAAGEALKSSFVKVYLKRG